MDLYGTPDGNAETDKINKDGVYQVDFNTVRYEGLNYRIYFSADMATILTSVDEYECSTDCEPADLLDATCKTECSTPECMYDLH